MFHGLLFFASVAWSAVCQLRAKGFPVGPYCTIKYLEAGFLCFVGHRADFYDFVGISEGFWTGIEDSVSLACGVGRLYADLWCRFLIDACVFIACLYIFYFSGPSKLLVFPGVRWVALWTSRPSGPLVCKSGTDPKMYKSFDRDRSQSTDYRVPKCMSPRRNWDPPNPSLPPGPKGGEHTSLRLRGWVVPIPTTGESLALCLLYGIDIYLSFVYQLIYLYPRQMKDERDLS